MLQPIQAVIPKRLSCCYTCTWQKLRMVSHRVNSSVSLLANNSVRLFGSICRSDLCNAPNCQDAEYSQDKHRTNFQPPTSHLDNV